MREKVMALNSYIRKEENLKSVIYAPTSAIQKRNKLSIASKRKERIKVRIETNEVKNLNNREN